MVATVALAATAGLTGAIGHNVVQLLPPSGTVARADDRWQPWSAARADELTAAGRPLFIDFTAAWCVTCQFNKKATLADAAVLADFDSKNVAMLRADWTRRDPEITTALAALGRNGVPVYVLQAPGKPPVVLTEILRKDDIRAALAAL